MKQSVLIPTAQTTVEIERKKSRFIAVLTPIEERSQVESNLAALRLGYPDPTHVVYAFRYGGLEREIEGMSDDGEPKGTAGRPVLDVLAGHGVTNAVLAVIRYFGGTKLGTGGLVRAYGDAAREVLAQAPLVRLIPRRILRLLVPYPLFGGVERVIAEFSGEMLEQEFATDISCSVQLPEAGAADFCRRLTDLSAGGIIIEPGDRGD
ncbi:YigZ family protein [Spirochaeta africana]|uniref:Impact N-terminal domain-containing protein n=1 Tax=Spirochaeta africana (strain ATCC 700263 / DSM 8902 / Z-7692) TaxID=889378 RepID=H9UMZ7_SPIAZ|nr:YigZ family protein [Spirochaeta africana]AFG38890.1 hypothetical protein Spiaf_2872 [Spirochaeta africana DSM 8902]